MGTNWKDFEISCVLGVLIFVFSVFAAPNAVLLAMALPPAFYFARNKSEVKTALSVVAMYSILMLVLSAYLSSSPSTLGLCPEVLIGQACALGSRHEEWKMVTAFGNGLLTFFIGMALYAVLDRISAPRHTLNNG